MPQSRVCVSYPEGQEFIPWKRKEQLLDSEPTFFPYYHCEIEVQVLDQGSHCETRKDPN